MNVQEGFGKFKLIKWGWTIIAILFVTISSIVVSFQEKSIMPFVKEVGGSSLASDTQLREKVLDARNNPSDSFYGRMGQFLGIIFVDLFFLYINFRIVLFLFNLIDKTSPFKNYLYTIITFVLLQYIYANSFLGVPLSYPFAGVIEFFKNIPFFIDPIVQMVQNSGMEWEQINQILLDKWGNAVNITNATIQV